METAAICCLWWFLIEIGRKAEIDLFGRAVLAAGAFFAIAAANG